MARKAKNIYLLEVDWESLNCDGHLSYSIEAACQTVSAINSHSETFILTVHTCLYSVLM